MRSRIPPILAILAILLLLPAVATAALVDEQRQGQGLIAQLQAGTKTCKDLSADDLDHIGEYVMFRALGSTSLHQAMNDRMTTMLGAQGESRVHQLLGARYAGCTTSSSATGSHGGMMGGYYNANGGFGAMMNSGNWSWMIGGTWQNMTRQDWQRLQHRLLGTNINTSSHHGWSMAATMAAILAGTLLIAVAIVVVIRRPFRRPPAASPSQ